MRIAIVGSEGYVGAALQTQLGGHDLLRIDAGVWREPGPGVIRERTFPKIIQRLRRFEPDHVVYLAALAHDPTGIVSARAFQENNTRIPADVVGALRCPVSIVSSLSVYSHAGHYPASKRALEERLTEITDWRDRVNIFRFGTLFGPSPAFRGHLLLNRMTADALRHGNIIVSNPALRRPVLHINSALSALVGDIANPDPRGQIFNLLDHCDTLEGYANLVGEALGVTDIRSGMYKDPDERDYGWPRQNTEQLKFFIQLLAGWMKANNTAFHDFSLDNLHLQEWHTRYYS